MDGVHRSSWVKDHPAGHIGEWILFQVHLLLGVMWGDENREKIDIDMALTHTHTHKGQ